MQNTLGILFVTVANIQEAQLKTVFCVNQAMPRQARNNTQTKRKTSVQCYAKAVIHYPHYILRPYFHISWSRQHKPLVSILALVI